jgi:hypothetical protein
MVVSLLAHILTPSPMAGKLKPIPFPPDYAPHFQRINREPSGPLPQADAVVCTYTAAEHQAMADVLSPGLYQENWNYYSEDFASYLPDLTYRSPAKEVRRLGEYAVTIIGEKVVLLFHSQCHLATDSSALPLRRLFAQIIRETGCSLFVDTGTAGGIGPNVVEGDTVVGQNLVFDCTSFLKDEPYAHESFPCTYPTAGIDWTQAEALMAVNAGQLRPEATRAPKVWTADVITCDSFLFDAVGDPFSLETYDEGRALVEEMDCSVLGLTAQDLGDAMPKYTSLRSVSDPQMPALPGGVKAEEAAAQRVYDQYGYAAQCATLCAVWQVIADMGGTTR